MKFGISFTLTWLNQAGALVHVYQDGSIRLNHGGTEMGQGLFLKVAQVAAEGQQEAAGEVRKIHWKFLKAKIQAGAAEVAHSHCYCTWAVEEVHSCCNLQMVQEEDRAKRRGIVVQGHGDLRIGAGVTERA